MTVAQLSRRLLVGVLLTLAIVYAATHPLFAGPSNDGARRHIIERELRRLDPPPAREYR